MSPPPRPRQRVRAILDSSDSKLIVSWLIGPRDAGSAYTMMHDLAYRLATRVQLTSDGLRLYVDAVDDAFGVDIDYAQLIKTARPGSLRAATVRPRVRAPSAEPSRADPQHVSTPVERQNLIRMGIRRFTRLERLWQEAREPGRVCALPRQLLPDPRRMSPAIGWRHGLRDVEWIVGLIERVRNKSGPAVGTKYRPRKST